jgi:hypothetical protein
LYTVYTAGDQYGSDDIVNALSPSRTCALDAL